jgi:hypothetical protein
MALAACDVHFRVSGTIASGNAQPLRGCHLVYEDRGKQHTSALTTPRFDEGFATGGIPKSVVITCDGHKPQVVEVPAGGRLGNIVLSPADSR